MHKNLHQQETPLPWLAPTESACANLEPLISVVLPVYNHVEMLPASIHSVLSQEECHLELIVVDDGSTEDISSAIRQFEPDPRFRLLSAPHGGIARALNRGFAETKGLFVTWTSADNLFLPGALNRMGRFLLANPAVGLVYANVQLIDEEGQAFRNSNYRNVDQSAADPSILELPQQAGSLSCYPDNFINACFLYRKWLSESLGAYDPNLRGVEDYDYWLRIKQLAEVAHIDLAEPYYCYRLHRSSLTETLNTDKLRKETVLVQSLALLREDNAGIPCDIEVRCDGEKAVNELQPLANLLTSAGHVISWGKGESPYLSISREVEAPLTNDTSIKVEAQNEGKGPVNSSLKYFCQAETFTPVLLKKSGAESCQPQDCLTQSLAVFPPLKTSPALRRARDNNFGAVTAEGSAGILLFFVPEGIKADQDNWLYQTLIASIGENKNLTFVLFCSSTEERRSADLVNQGLSDNRNLRIIDCSAELHSDKPIAGNNIEPLMYAISGCSAVLSIKERLTGDPEALSALRMECFLAAHAGLAVTAISKDAETCKNAGVDCQYLRTLLPLPHLKVQENIQLPFEATPLSQNSLEQWIWSQSEEQIARKVSNFFWC